MTNPNILAHAGLATTDIACAATTTLALFAAVRVARGADAGDAAFVVRRSPRASPSPAGSRRSRSSARRSSRAMRSSAGQRGAWRSIGRPYSSADVGRIDRGGRCGVVRRDLGGIPICDRADASSGRVLAPAFLSLHGEQRASDVSARHSRAIADGGTTSPSRCAVKTPFPLLAAASSLVQWSNVRA